MFIGIYIAIVLWLSNGWKQMSNKVEGATVNIGNALFMLFYLVMLCGTIGYTIEMVLGYGWVFIRTIFLNG